jgi:hypothetical protein
MKLLIMQFSSASYYFIPLGSSTLFSDPPQSTLSSSVRRYECFISTRTQPILMKFGTGDMAHFITRIQYESFSIIYNSCVTCRSNQNLSSVLKTAYSTNYLYLFSSYEFHEISSETAFTASVATLFFI